MTGESAKLAGQGGEKLPVDETSGRTRRRRKEARPGEIVAAAFQEFTERGFAATRLDDVAARAGISKGTIYIYFETKEALFEAVVREMISPILDRVQVAQADPSLSSEQLLRFAIETIYSELVFTERRQIMRLLIAESARFPQLVKFYHREAVSRGLELLGAIVGRGVARGEFRDGAMARCPEVVMGPAIMMAIWKLLFEAHDPLDLELFKQGHLEMVLGGLRQTSSAG